jgi:SET domain-containing protein
MAVDTDWIIDAAAAAPDCSAFHPVHMNHSKVRANVARYYDRAAGRVAFFASCDIVPGDELLYDYGRAYWRGREHLELP